MQENHSEGRATTKGVLLLVNAGDRSKEAESIMERNSGQIRTDTATEHPYYAGWH